MRAIVLVGSRVDRPAGEAAGAVAGGRAAHGADRSLRGVAPGTETLRKEGSRAFVII